MPGNFRAWSSFPSAPFASRLILEALQKNFPELEVDTSDDLPANAEEGDAGTLQWSSYDSLSHELTLTHPTTVLASSYTIRKSIIRKHFLHRSFTSYITKHPECYLATRHAVPQTWSIDISWADELDELWSDELWELGEQLGRNEDLQPHERKWFILKPSMSDRGMGIRLFESRDALRDIFESFEEEEEEDEAQDDSIASADGDDSGLDTSVIASQLRHFVIQEYITNALLLDPSQSVIPGQPAKSSGPEPRKFHIRAYCIAFGALELFINPHFLALFAGASYAPPSRGQDDDEALNLLPHLTNTSLQTPTPDNPDPNDNVRLLSEMIGCPILSSEDAGAVLTKEDVDNITSQVYQVLADTFRAALETSVHFQALPNAFELFGADLLVSHDPSAEVKFSVSILELNSEPAIELTGARLSWILETRKVLELIGGWARPDTGFISAFRCKYEEPKGGDARR